MLPATEIHPQGGRCPACAADAKRLSWRRIRRLCLVVVGIGVLAVLGSCLEEALWWQHRKPLLLVCDPARALALQTQAATAPGREPSPDAERVTAFTDANGKSYVNAIQEGAQRLGVPVPRLCLSEPADAEYSGVLVALVGPTGRVEILPQAVVRVTSNLAPAPSLRLSWLEVGP